MPQIDQVVMCRITRVEGQTGAYVHLLEYDIREGMIMASECSRKRIKSVARVLKPGKEEALLVTKVDENEGFIDLSRKKVQAEDIKACEERFNKALKVNNIAK